MKQIRSLIASVLAVAMIFALTACGTPGAGQNSTPGASGKSGTEDTPAFVYVPSFEEVKTEDAQALSAVCFTDGGFYTTPSEVVGHRTPDEGEVEEYEGQFDILAEQLVFVGYDGKTAKLENYEPILIETEGNHYGSVELNKLAADAQGNLAGLYHRWESWNEAPEGVDEDSEEYWDYNVYDEAWLLRTMDSTGREKSLTKIETTEGEWFWPNGLVYAEGKAFVAGSDGLRIYGADGSVSKISVDGYTQSVLTLRDGTVCLVFSDNVTNENRIGAVDPASGRVTQTWKCPRNAYNFITGGGEYDLYYQSGINIYGYKLSTESGEKLFSWLNVDVAQQNLAGYTVREDGSVFAVSNTWDSKWENVTTEFVTLVKKSFADAPQKKELTLACQWVDNPLQNAVIRFNRSNNIRINVIDYSQYNTDEDWTAGLTKLTTEIMSGNMPDIIALQGLPYQQMAAKGLLTDLYPFIDKDSEISRDDFLPNVLRALEENGSLYSTVTTFTVMTLLGAADKVGDEPGWSVEDLNAALAAMPQGCSVLDEYTTSGDILRTELTLDSDFYIDWNNGKVNFDSKEFIDLLNFARRFPNAFDMSNYDWEEYESEFTRIQNDKQLLMRVSLGDFNDLTMYDAQFGGKMTYIGYPTVSGVGSCLNVNSGYAISSSCADKDAAWQFLRGFMTAKTMESDYFWGFPANKNLLEKKLQEAMTVEYEKDENGNYRYDENGERIPVSRGGVWIEGTDEVVEFYALTQEQADRAMAVINSADKVYMENSTVLKVLFEQIDAFLSGQKTAEEVARLIQGKMSIYINEQR